MNLKTAIRELRSEFGESQQAFSTRLGMAIVSVANFETGKRKPDTASLLKLARTARKTERADVQRVIEAALSESVGAFVVIVDDEAEYKRLRGLMARKSAAA